MKTLISTCFAAALVLLTSTTFAAVWRVNNNPVVDADFNALTTAINAAAVGDTLYLEGSTASYGTLSLTKQLTIIGTGYFISDNDTTQAFLSPSEISTVTISGAAAGSVLTGLQISGFYSSSSGGLVRILADNITIDRCYIRNNISSMGRGNVLSIDANRSNVVVKRSFIYRDNIASSSGSSDPRKVVEIGSGCTDIVFENNIIKLGAIGFYTGSYSSYAIDMANDATGIFRNNVINGRVVVFNAIFNNNIMTAGTGTAYTETNMIQVIHNLGNSTQFGTDNGNQSNVVMTDVFEAAPGSENVDNYYILKAGSPAIGAGVSGIDAGAFGGDDPYYLSGLPAIPAIFEATIPTIVTTASGININTKIKAHD